MLPLSIVIPKRFGLRSALDIADQIASTPIEQNIILDFEKMGYAGPSSLVLIPNLIQQIRKYEPSRIIIPQNYQQCTYPAHMGFFKAFELDFGNSPGEAKGSKNYIPITFEDIVSIQRKALASEIKIGEIVEHSASKLAHVLAGKAPQSTIDIFTYCICEMIRNVAEHSESKSVCYCAQYWPSQDRAEIAILDQGIGIKATLSKNESLHVNDELSALELSLKQGISRKHTAKTTSLQDDYWSNEGYGLYMVSELCRNGGNFFIGSHGASLYTESATTKTASFSFRGTMIRMVLRPSKIVSLSNMIDSIKTSKAEPITLSREL